MNFILNYADNHKRKFDCHIKKDKINRIILGSGGSNNIIIDFQDNGIRLINKVIPQLIQFNVKIERNADQLEIKFYQFFTKKYMLTNRTPHIVGIYNHQTCTRIDKLLRMLVSECPSLEDRLTKKQSESDDYKICDLLLDYEAGLVRSEYDIVLLEYCPTTLSQVLSNIVHQENGPSILKRILFQLIFTLAIIKDDYPGFEHGDFFVRNILISFEELYDENDYIAYHYQKEIFYFPANGMYAKMNDFGKSVIVNKIESSTYRLYQPSYERDHRNAFNQKTDIFNLLHSIYDGHNLGTQSIATLLNQRKKSIPIIKLMAKFLDTKTIDKINKNNRYLLDITWHIDRIKILEDTVKTPDEYMMGNYFTEYQNLPKGGNVVRHFNQ